MNFIFFTARWASMVLGLLAYCNVNAQVLTLGHAGEYSMSSHVELLKDPQAILSIEEVSTPQKFEFNPDPSRSLGFTSDAIWLRLTFKKQDETVRNLWWLEVKTSLLSDAKLYEPTSRGDFIERQGTVGGNRQPDLIHSRHPLFAIEIEDLKSKTYYLRITSQAALTVPISIWQPEAFIESDTKESFFWGIVFGAYLLVIIFYGIFWFWSHEKIHQSYVFFVTINFLAAFFTSGWPLTIWPNLSSEIFIQLLGTWICTSIYAGILFSTQYLEVKKTYPKFTNKLVYSSLFVSLFGVISVWLGYYGQTIPYIQILSLVAILFVFSSAGWLASQGSSKGKLFLLAFSFFFAGVAWRYMRNMGVIEPNFWNDNSYQIGAFIHMLLMSVGIFANYNQMRRDKSNAEVRAATEAKLRNDQRDFMTMVSHEFLTPLSIVQASASNLLDDVTLGDAPRNRVNKIIRANERITDLMNNYLSKERILLETHDMVLKNTNIYQICKRVCEDTVNADDLKIKLFSIDTNILIICDPDLIYIAIMNLVSNAIRHSPEPGSVSISIAKNSDHLQIKVTDHGPGISDNEKEHIFKRFFRGRRTQEKPGAGLGLHIVSSIADRHNGQIGTRNIEAGGCEFLLSLPIVD